MSSDNPLIQIITLIQDLSRKIDEQESRIVELEDSMEEVAATLQNMDIHIGVLACLEQKGLVTRAEAKEALRPYQSDSPPPGFEVCVRGDN